MSRAKAVTRRKKPAGQYHHGDLRRALVAEAVRTIQAKGVEQLTLRTIGERLGVSRTALYRHFSDKQALLAAVSTEGFRTLRLALTDAWGSHGRGWPGFEAMAHAYVRFAVTHPAHYRVMFGRFVESIAGNADLKCEADGAFGVLVAALVAQQEAGIIRRDEPNLQARFVWAAVHGTAMLAIDGQLNGDDDGEVLNAYAIERLRSAIAVDRPS